MTRGTGDGRAAEPSPSSCRQRPIRLRESGSSSEGCEPLPAPGGAWRAGGRRCGCGRRGVWAGRRGHRSRHRLPRPLNHVCRPQASEGGLGTLLVLRSSTCAKLSLACVPRAVVPDLRGTRAWGSHEHLTPDDLRQGRGGCRHRRSFSCWPPCCSPHTACLVPHRPRIGTGPRTGVGVPQTSRAQSWCECRHGPAACGTAFKNCNAWLVTSA